MKPRRFAFFIAIAFSLLGVVPVYAQNSDAVFELISKGDLKRAQEAVNTALKKDSGSADFSFANALIADKKGESKKAIGLYLDVIESHPTMLAPYNNLAIHYASAGDYKSAVATLEQALAIDRAIATTYGNLQSIFARMASLAYRKALNSDTPTTPLRLAIIDSVPERATSLQPSLVASAESFIEKSLSASNNESLANTTASEALAEAQESSPQSINNNIVVAAAAQIETPQSEDAVSTESPGSESAPVIAEVTAINVDAIPVKPAETEKQIVAPTKPTEAAKKLAEQNAAEKQALINHVKSWANAWSDRDVDRYLSHYSNRFEPRDDLSLEEWKKQRYGRLRWREFIIVKPSRYSIELDKDIATVNFNQYYKSERFEDTIRKTLKLRKENGKWRITREFI